MQDIYNLLHRYQKGEEDLFNEIFIIIKPYLEKLEKKFNDEDVYAILLGSIPNMLLRLNLKKLTNNNHILNYLKRCFKNNCIDSYRKLQRENEYVFYNSDTVDLLGVIGYNDFRDDLNSNIEFLDIIKDLTQKEQYIIRKNFEEQFSIAEIAFELGLSRQGVNKIKNNALKKLKNQLLHSIF